MTANQLTPAQRQGNAPILLPEQGWGYGVAVELARSAEDVPAGAYGWNGGLVTSWIVDPATDTVAMLLTQVSFTSPEPPPAHKALRELVFG
jgi:CubicO group peptidase (beta-lactamase class C family)